MRFLLLLPIALLASCSGVNTVSNVISDSTDRITSRFSGPKVRVVEVRPEALKEFKTGEDKALAYQSQPRYTASHSKSKYKPTFESYTLPADFVLPDLPQISEEGNEAEATLLPPRG